jgi:hypothetical protein
MIRKIIVLLGINFILSIIIISCDYGFCKDVDYYDFSKVEFQIKNTNPIDSADSLVFKIRQLDTHYMSEIFPPLSPLKATYALNCDYGWNGMKIPLTKIEITSDSDFNDSHRAHELLNDLIIVGLRKDENLIHSAYEYIKFDSVSFERLLPREDFLDPEFYIAEHPTLDMSHKLTIKIFKSNRDTIVAESVQIIWK